MLVRRQVGVSHNKGTLNWGPYHKDPTIWGTIFGTPIFGSPQVAPKAADSGKRDAGASIVRTGSWGHIYIYSISIIKEP